MLDPNNPPVKHIRGSLASFVHEDGRSLCDTDALAEELLQIFKHSFSGRIPFAVCSELQIFASAYIYYRDRCPKSKRPKPRKRREGKK